MSPPKILYVDTIGGVAGDMLIAALLDAGASESALREVPDRLKLTGVELRITRVERHSIGALHLMVSDAGADDEHRRHALTSWRSIRRLLEAADISVIVRSTSLKVLSRLAEAEGRIHGLDADQVHFHEIGAVDTLVDVVGAATLLEGLDIARTICSPLPIGHGVVRAAHGLLPLPAPATIELLPGVPVYGVNLEAETVTPTGAALVSTLAQAWGPVPAMRVERIGYGAGTKDFSERPNLVRVIVGESVSVPAANDTKEAVLLETNLDDLNPELIPDVAEQCFAAGALDVWTTAVTMKKGRPGVVFSALTRPELEVQVTETMLRHTTTLGVRALPLRRFELDREHRTVEVDGHPVRVKLGRLNGRIVNVSPEHDDCADIARLNGQPVKSIWIAALVAAQELR